MGRIRRGWELAKLSLRVLRADRSLALFPVLSAIAIFVATIAIALPAYAVAGFDEQSPALYVAGVLIAFVGTYLAIFFNVALVSCAVRSFDGHDTTIGEGVAAASARAGVIFRWALLATTVGLLLRAIEERVPLAGRIAVWLVGAAWAIATFFVVPILAFEQVGPVESVKRSASLVRERWGEAVVGSVGIGLAVMLAVLVVAVPLAALGVFAMGASVALGTLLLVLAAAVLVAGSVVSSTLNQIFNAALYTYARTGAAPGGFTDAQLSGAFRTKG